MTKQFDESFSAFVDGELAESEYDAVIQQICQDVECKRRWQAYHLISDTLRRNLPPAVDPNFSNAVMKSLESEPTVLAPTKPGMSPMTKRVAGAAIAASVAAVAVLGVQISNETDDQSATLAQMPSSKEFVRMAQPNPRVEAMPAQAQAQGQAKLHPLQAAAQRNEAQITSINKFHPQLSKYLVDHNQHVSGTRIQGMMPYARIVVSPSSEQQGQIKR